MIIVLGALLGASIACLVVAIVLMIFYYRGMKDPGKCLICTLAAKWRLPNFIVTWHSLQARKAADKARK